MDRVVQRKLDDIAQLCTRYGVRRLELFGSAARKDFDSTSSDLDFLVEFRSASIRGAADRYFGLLEALEALFRRPVDLVEIRAIKNPYFLEAIQSSRTVLYAA